MSIERLDTERVRELIAKKGLKQIWVAGQTGLSRSAAYLLIRDGLLPKDQKRKNMALKNLAKTLDVEVPQILLRLEFKRTA